MMNAVKALSGGIRPWGRAQAGRRRLRLPAAIVVSAAACTIMSACGSAGSPATAGTPSSSPASSPASSSSSSSSSSGGVAQASAQVAKYLQPVALTPPGPAFNAAKAKGKNVWRVTFLASNPFLATEGSVTTKALQAEGVNVHTCNGQGNPVALNTCIKQAISQHAAEILVDGVAPAAFTQGIQAAKAAHIPIVNATGYDSSVALASGLVGNVSQPFKLAGKLAADLTTKDSNGHAHVLFLTAPDVIGSVEEEQSYAAELKSQCPGCTLETQGVTIVNWATSLGSTTTSALARDPSIDYVVPAFDPMAQFTDPAIMQAGKASTVKIITVNGSLPQMQDLQKHSQIVGEVGIDMHALGYQIADEVLRVLSGAAPVTPDLAPVRIFDDTNVAGLQLTPAAFTSGSWYVSPAKYDAMMTKLWQG